MQKINQLFSRKVIDQRSGDVLGSVRDVVLSADMRRIVALVVGAGGWGSKDRVVRWDELIGVGEFIVVDDQGAFPTLDDDSEVRELRQGAEQLTGKRVISASGEQVGSVEDTYYDRSGAILGFEIKRGVFGGHPALRADAVQSVGPDAIIAAPAELVAAEDLRLPAAPQLERLSEHAVGDQAGEGRPLLDPALGEPQPGERNGAA